ncbi:MAG: carboxypeptidase-like regulatory domain-containing protein, partial [Acidobacteriota bacterium]|nr:carboxypeptidase-like regulatory domain-containing protein [Acidobacteriota bacterium]
MKLNWSSANCQFAPRHQQTSHEVPRTGGIRRPSMAVSSHWRKLTVCATPAAVCAVLLLCLLSSFLFAQTPDKGIITGRVVTEDGTGLPGITVRLLSVNSKSRFNGSRTASTDDEGSFRFTDLPPRAYSLQAENGRAYVRAPQSAAEIAQPQYYHEGESGTLTMVRGGVITGRVTNASNDAMIALPLAAIMIRDAEGNPIGNQAASLGVQAFTDDRGIYRFYGLTPGTYVVLANTGNPYWGSQASLYDNEAPTYYPSSTRDSAQEVQVVSGGEATGIDIRYRGERGHAVSGKVIGGNSAQVTLVQAATGAQVALGSVYRGAADATFDLYGIADGEYEIIARTGNDAETPAASQPRRIMVRGADVTGLELRMLALGSLAGRIVIETLTATCDKPVKIYFQEFVISARPEKSDSESAIKPNAAEAPVNDKGEFVIGELQAIRYRLMLNLPNERLYVKSILAGSAGAAATPAKLAAAKPAATLAVSDFARNGIALKQGEKI